LNDFCVQWDPQQIVSLKLDYTRLFIGLEKTLAPPYESVYLGKDHILFEKQTLEVRQFYQRFNLEIGRLHKEPDDHIGYELSFVSALCRVCSDALKQSDPSCLQEARNTLEQFLSCHLLKWVELFLSKVIENAETQYFRGIVYLTRGAIKSLLFGNRIGPCSEQT